MGGLGQDSSIVFSSLPNKRQHFTSCFHPSRLEIQFHDHLAARALFNNSQLWSQAPSPQREPHRAAWTAAGLLLRVCSVTLISSMSMFPHLSRLQCRDLCCCINNTACYCPRGSLLCLSSFSLFLQFVTQFTQTWSVEHFRPCVWLMGTTCTYWGRKNKTKKKGFLQKMASSFKWKECLCSY